MNYENASSLCANFPLSLSGGDYEEVQQMLMHFTVENVSDFWTATQEQQLKVKAGSCTSVAKAFNCELESRMKGDRVSKWEMD